MHAQKGEITMVKSTTVSSVGQSARDVRLALARHEPLVSWIVHRQCLGPLPHAEALQAGRIGLWRALQGYDPTRGCAFSSYAVPAITRHVWRAVAQATPRLPEALMPHPPQPSPDLDALAQRHWVCQALYALVARLPEPHHTVIVAHYGLSGRSPQTFAAIGQTQGVTRQRVHQLHTEALLWLAHPAHSLVLRRCLERNTLADYRAYLVRQRAWARARRYSQ
jgi:RNA polymerase sigma factor (sigma-70 family)